MLRNDKSTGLSVHRKVKNFVIKPRLQLSLAWYLLSIAIGTFTLIFGYIFYNLQTMVSNLSEIYKVDEAALDFIQISLFSSTRIIFVLILVVGALNFIAWIKLSHKIFGPLVPFSKHIGELIEGNYDSRVSLRKGDLLCEMQDQLNDLAETLQKKHP